MILLIDNYDSFTYNLYQYLCELGASVKVIRNDAMSLSEIDSLQPDQIVISPGPGTPDQAGISVEIIKYFSGKLPILGVCLGHQCIARAFGGTIKQAGEIKHGKVSLIYHDNLGIFKDMPLPFTATRYHSLIVDPDSMPECLVTTARTDSGIIMGLRHRSYPVMGVQFHPESILTETGKVLLNNFLEIKGEI